MESKCPQCDSNATLYFQATDLNQKTCDSTFNYYRCINCKLIFLKPIPEDLSNYYKSEYPPYKIPNSLEQLVELEKQLHWRVDLVKRYKNNGKMLEIGPSYGAFAYGAQKSGFQVDAIEMDENCCNFINSKTKVNAINATDVVGTMSANKKTYDLIALWHNIEHLVDPWAVLRQCSMHLAPNGVLVISTPNPDSIQFKLFKKYWVHLDAPRHLQLIPSSLLTGFLKRLDMELVFTTTTDPDGLKLNAMSWHISTAHVFGISNDRNIFRRIVSRVLSLAMSPIERLGQLGTAYTIVYRKK
jgi:SAM-dependent methyltransferase